jgi:uncharacterized protein YuzE
MQKTTYDAEAQILTIQFSSAKSVDSKIIKNLVLDYDSNDKLVKIDILDVDLAELIEQNILSPDSNGNLFNSARDNNGKGIEFSALLKMLNKK